MSVLGLIAQIRLEGAPPPPPAESDWLLWLLVISGTLAGLSVCDALAVAGSGDPS